MEFIKKYALIKEAQLILIQAPRDLAHEITHHYRVWMFAEQVGATVEENFDKDVLELVCWWHDVVVTDNIISGDKQVPKTGTYLSCKFDEPLKTLIYESIVNHEFGDTPTTTEGKILQDADKLDILSWDRVNIFIEAVKSGLYPKDKAQQAISEIYKNWLPVMLDRYHFEKSKEIHRSLEHQVPLQYKAFEEVFR